MDGIGDANTQAIRRTLSPSPIFSSRAVYAECSALMTFITAIEHPTKVTNWRLKCLTKYHSREIIFQKKLQLKTHLKGTYFVQSPRIFVLFKWFRNFVTNDICPTSTDSSSRKDVVAYSKYFVSTESIQEKVE